MPLYSFSFQSLDLPMFCFRNGAVLLPALLLVLCGCGQQPVTFTTNAVHAATLEQEFGQPMAEAEEDVRAILVDLFGTAAEPRLPKAITADDSLRGLMDLGRLSRAAGAVSSDRDGEHVGLYREHCSTCHGVSGDGKGPAALFQNPYPRDYRAGIFKFKSTPRGAKPTRQDLAKTVLQGLPGTGMPAFGLLIDEGNDEDVQALLDYVIYLSIRGELERRLLRSAASEFDYASDGDPTDQLLRPENRERYPEEYAEQAEWIAEQVAGIAREWATADAQVPEIPTPPAAVQPLLAADGSTPVDEAARVESIAIGREIFHGLIANCSTCHGTDGAAENLPADYDDWTKEWTTQMGVDPKDEERLGPYFEAGALPPRRLPARRLTLGGFRGGNSPEDIYLRIVHGIDGTPMPAINRVETEGPTGLTGDQIWHLVHYVLSLSAPQSPQWTATGGGAWQ